MIHTLLVTPSSSLAEVRKEFRKKLMTGGCVLRLEGVRIDQEARDFIRAIRDAAFGNNVESMLLVEAAELPCLSAETLEMLLREAKAKNLTHLLRRIYEHPALPAATRKIIAEEVPSAIEIQLGSELNEGRMREIFLSSLGDTEENIKTRIELCEYNLPDDIAFLMARDPSPRVRFARRNY